MRLSRVEREPEPGCGFADFSEQFPQVCFRRVQDDSVVHIGVVAVHAAHGLAQGVDARRKVDARNLRYDGAEPESCLSRRDERAEHRTGAGVFDVALDFREELVVLDAREVVPEVDEEGVALSSVPPDMPGEVLLESPPREAHAFSLEARAVVMDEIRRERREEDGLHIGLLRYGVAHGRRMDVADDATLTSTKYRLFLRPVRAVSEVFLEGAEVRQEMESEGLCLGFPAARLTRSAPPFDECIC